MDNLTAEISHGTPTPPAPKPEIPTISDPVRFMNDFEASQYYADAYAKFFEGKTLAADVTEQEKHAVFSENEDAKLALLDFAEKQEHYHYDPSFFNLEVNLAINSYVDQTRDLGKMMRGASRDEIISVDLLRTTYHDLVANALKEAGLVPSYRMGKAFARLILIDKHLDNFETAKEKDLLRLQRFLGVRPK